MPRWLLADASASGFPLIRDGEGSCRAAVGELIALRLTSRNSEPSAPAVVLPADQARGLPTTVVVPARMFREGQIVELDLHEQMLRLVLSELHEETGAFSRYGVMPAPPRGRHAAGDTRFAEPP